MRAITNAKARIRAGRNSNFFLNVHTDGYAMIFGWGGDAVDEEILHSEGLSRFDGSGCDAYWWYPCCRNGVAGTAAGVCARVQHIPKIH